MLQKVSFSNISNVLEADTVEVVNVVMNNMEDYLPSDVIQQDKDV